MPSAESCGESFARPTRRSIDAASVMGSKVLLDVGGVTEDGGEAAVVNIVVSAGADSSNSGLFISVADVIAGFDWCFEDFLAITVRLYSFRP